MNNIKFEESVCKTLGGFAIAVGLGLTGIGEAQAGVVSGNFDPAFGAALAGWDYSGTFDLSFSDEWTSKAYGGFQTTVDATHKKLDLVALVSALDRQQVVLEARVSMKKDGAVAGSNSIPLALQSLTFETKTGLLTNWESNVVELVADFSGEGFGLNEINFDDGTHSFQFKWSNLLGGAALSCLDCRLPGPNGGTGTIDGSLDGLTVSYAQTSGDPPYNGSVAGPTVGSVVSVYATNAQGVIALSTVVTYPPAAIPEPGTLALILGGLMGVGWARRRKA